jgi:hypothetical protein
VRQRETFPIVSVTHTAPSPNYIFRRRTDTEVVVLFVSDTEISTKEV